MVSLYQEDISGDWETDGSRVAHENGYYMELLRNNDINLPRRIIDESSDIRDTLMLTSVMKRARGI